MSLHKGTKTRWLFDTSLTEEAKEALSKGNGIHGKFAVNIAYGEPYIALIDDKGRAEDWVLIVKGGEPIEALEA